MKTLPSLFVGVAFAVSASAAPALVLGVTEGVTYRATDKEVQARFEAIAELLAKATRQPVRIQVLSRYAELREALKQQQVDIAFIHPAHLALEGVKSGQYRAAAWTAGYTEYKVSFLCKDAQPISNWRTLAGKAMVTPDPDSITAVITRAMLREHGVALAAVKMQTTRYQDAVPFYVENNFAAYGATAAKAVIKAWKDKGGNTCAESRGVPIKQWITSTRLDAATETTLRDTLLGLAQNEPGKKALAASTYSGFVPASEEARQALTAWLGL